MFHSEVAVVAVLARQRHADNNKLSFPISSFSSSIFFCLSTVHASAAFTYLGLVPILLTQGPCPTTPYHSYTIPSFLFSSFHSASKFLLSWFYSCFISHALLLHFPLLLFNLFSEVIRSDQVSLVLVRHQWIPLRVFIIHPQLSTIVIYIVQTQVDHAWPLMAIHPWSWNFQHIHCDYVSVHGKTFMTSSIIYPRLIDQNPCFSTYRDREKMITWSTMFMKLKFMFITTTIQPATTGIFFAQLQCFMIKFWKFLLKNTRRVFWI